MIKNLIVAGFCTIFILSGCAKNDSNLGAQDPYKEDGNTINVNNQRAELYNEGKKHDKSEDFGYVRHQRNPVMGTNSASDHYAAIDREQLAKIISQLSTDIPNVNDVSTLVTDGEVIVVYKTDTKDRNLTADQVKRTAASAVPSWFRIYVTDNTHLRQDVENFATLDSDTKNINSLMSNLINRVKESPQGTSTSKQMTE
ncbi:sporulation protein [Bacillus sp. DNRA2]|uniref:YhcN/YlaJ family sporulation lipoprotein n=1 Tax=Bacillus sp. DNRA2 TaxID=2723053 RepID=UPI00145D2F5A|nr:YhcN/YlaJ family sporulation lipoprotein [Bacillus sp. DNRA2]NMD69009.1 sporulation protein [Bacillus sp. DNRA2]